MARNKAKSKTPNSNRAGRISFYGERMRPKTINMPESMYSRLGKEANIRSLPGGESEMQRLINEWFFTALDDQRKEDPTATTLSGEVVRSRF